MQRAADAGLCPQGQCHPSPVGKHIVDPEEVGHVALGERPDGLSACDRPGEGHVRIELEPPPPLELVVGVAVARDDVDDDRVGLHEHDEPRFGPHRLER